MINNSEDQQVSYISKREVPVPPISYILPEVTVSTSDPVTGAEENEYCYVNPHTINVHTSQGDSGSNQTVLRKRHMSHLMSCRRHTHARVKSIVAEPPTARKQEVAKARYKLQPNILSAQV